MYIHTVLLFTCHMEIPEFKSEIPCTMQNSNHSINVFHSQPLSLINLCQNSWETVGKKRSLGKEGPSEIKEIREKKGGEREASRGRGGSNRRGRGISRGREGKKVTKDVCPVLKDEETGLCTCMFLVSQ